MEIGIVLSITGTITVGTSPASEGPVYGPDEIVDYGPFVDSGWTKTGPDGFPPAIVGGKIVFDPNETDLGSIRRNAANTLTAGDYFVETVIDSIGQGEAQPIIGGVGGTARSVAGSYEETITITALNQHCRIDATESDAVYSKFRVRRVVSP